MTKRIELGKSPAYYRFLRLGLLGVAAFIIFANAHFTVKGLNALPNFPAVVAWGVGVGMVIVESAVTTAVFSGDFQEAIATMFDPDEDDEARSSLGQMVSTIFKVVCLVGGLCIIVFLYWFDYVSTYQGLHGAGTPATVLTVLTTLFLNFGNEAAAFLMPIIEHLHRKARISQAQNRMKSEPEAIRSEHELRKAIANVRREVNEDVATHSSNW